MEQKQEHWLAKTRTFARRVGTGVLAWVKKGYEKLKQRYGPKYSAVMVSVVFFSLFLPVPGSSLVGVASIVAIAEIHRAISRRGGVPEALAYLVVAVKANMPFWAGGWQSPLRWRAGRALTV